MYVTVLKSKLHNAIVSEANLYYEGSITIDKDLMERAMIIDGERVQIVNLDNGERLETYTIAGERNSGIIGINGPAALKCKKGHRIHIISYASLDIEQAKVFNRKILFLDENNRVKNNNHNHNKI